MIYTLLEFLIEEVSKNRPPTSQDIAKNNSYFLLSDGEAILPKIPFPHAIITEHGETKLVPNSDVLPLLTSMGGAEKHFSQCQRRSIVINITQLQTV